MYLPLNDLKNKNSYSLIDYFNYYFREIQFS